MKALVIGGNGFVGSHLVDLLIDIGWDVVVLDINERRFDTLPQGVRFIRGDYGYPYLIMEALVGVDIVFHLAWATIHETANQNPLDDIHANLIPSIRLIENCKLAGVSKIVFLSSGGTIYGPPERLPIPEVHQQTPINVYGIMKLTVEKYLQMTKHLFDLEYVVLRPSVPYGPRQNPLGRQGSVAIFQYRVAHGLPITIWGDGQTSRDYFYISDLTDALVISAECKLNQHRIFNIGGTEEVSLLRIIELIEEIVGNKAIVKYHSARRFDVSKIVLDTRLARRELGWQPKVPLTKGLVETWRWMSSTID